MTIMGSYYVCLGGWQEVVAFRDLPDPYNVNIFPNYYSTR